MHEENTLGRDIVSLPLRAPTEAAHPGDRRHNGGAPVRGRNYGWFEPGAPKTCLTTVSLFTEPLASPGAKERPAFPGQPVSDQFQSSSGPSGAARVGCKNLLEVTEKKIYGAALVASSGLREVVVRCGLGALPLSPLSPWLHSFASL